ncbi:MAG: xanthine dehydrogenase family protein subunit M [Anaerolineae bacterium]|nr:xanthine dehydrogenase family protein subunit M [Anaerolineales bacterium]MCQ3977839.1 xanthine dehydrogenase family protein subunit M [Anaerolineae bacterium]
MYPPKFDYYRANSLNDAVALLQQHGEAKVLAGGHSLIPVMNLRLADPGTLIDIGRVSELKGISVQGNLVRIGALTTHAMIAASADVPTVLSEAAGMIGDPQVRNRGTIGGNIAHADPASDLPTVLTALGATIHTTGPNGSRKIAADDFFTGLFATALQDGEIVTAIEVAKSGAGSGSAYAKLFNPASRYAMVGAAAIVTVSGGNCTAVGVAVGGLTPSATRAKSVEAALVGKPLDEATISAAAAAVANDLGDDIIGDIHASADYRQAMAPVFVKRALMTAAQRAK